jgi:NAD(P)-dependent dehydrogenase (short-subunit alcohol dehydrogenase family)
MNISIKGKTALICGSSQGIGLAAAQELAFNGTELKFAIGSLTNDNWQVGFCRPGEFDAWRGARK